MNHLEARVRRRLAEWEAADCFACCSRRPDRSFLERLPGSVEPSAHRRSARTGRRARGMRQHRLAPAPRRPRGVRRDRAAVRRLQAGRARAVFFERLPGQHRRADDADREGRRDLLGRAEPRQPDRRHAAVGARHGSCFRTTTCAAWRSFSRARLRTATGSSSSSRSSAWTAISRRSPSTPRCAGGGAALIVDEAHAVGIYGERGSGLVEAAGIERRRLRLDQHRGQGARRQRRVRGRPRLGDRLSRSSARGRSSSRRRRRRRSPTRSTPAST